ncbi:unnamed protein product [Cyprideis torosa]|uniref:Uncharacterized protein n=1 Tax=Cyprideis torosa TaxID=163714 RepID=A0A7R8WKW9_9CRUS|nr:unnamed protein product [Cyprideis torosa]CAG0900931.1 unnamed protein product [Cyprideis torosa]
MQMLFDEKQVKEFSSSEAVAMKQVIFLLLVLVAVASFADEDAESPECTSDADCDCDSCNVCGCENGNCFSTMMECEDEIDDEER